MRYIKNFNESIDAEPSIKEKLKSINDFGRYIHETWTAPIYVGKYIYDDITSFILFWKSSLGKIYGIPNVSKCWVSFSVIKEYDKKCKLRTTSTDKMEKSWSNPQENLINRLYAISKSEIHDDEDITLIKDVLIGLSDDRLDLEIEKFYLPRKLYDLNLKTKFGGLNPVYIVSFDINVNFDDVACFYGLNAHLNRLGLNINKVSIEKIFNDDGRASKVTFLKIVKS